jgi:rhodanese-related sulfurtransferase
MDSDMALKIRNELNRKGIKVVTGTRITEIRRAVDQLSIIAENGRYSADLVILSAGVKPNTELAVEAGLEIGESGGIKVNSFLQTSDDKVFAIGDCAESINLITKKHDYWPLGSISTKMGRIAADNIMERRSQFEGHIGTAMFRIFDINVARTGLTCDRARKQGFDAESVLATGLDRAHYYRESEYIFLKVIADRESRRILGAQGFGRGEVIAKIDILACAITRQMTLDEIFKLDLGYSPAFNNPIDMAQTACLVLNNKTDGLFRTISVSEMEQERSNLNLVDVSPWSEYSLNSIPGSLNIPLESIRQEGLPYDRGEPIVLYSRTSSGAYEAYMHLATKGWSNMRVLEGGYLFWER